MTSRTSRIRFKLGAVLLPLHNPLRVAEDTVTLDVLSNRRVDLTAPRYQGRAIQAAAADQTVATSRRHTRRPDRRATRNRRRSGYRCAMSYQVTEVQKYLKGASYPMDGKQLSELAKKNGAPDDLVKTLGKLDEVEGPNGVMKRIKDQLGGSTN